MRFPSYIIKQKLLDVFFQGCEIEEIPAAVTKSQRSNECILGRRLSMTEKLDEWDDRNLLELSQKVIQRHKSIVTVFEEETQLANSISDSSQMLGGELIVKVHGAKAKRSFLRFCDFRFRRILERNRLRGETLRGLQACRLDFLL